MITLLSPIFVGLITLVIEYWIVKPVAESKKIFTVILSITAFLAVCIFVGSLLSSSLQYLSNAPSPTEQPSEASGIAFANVAFALGIYICIVTLWLCQNSPHVESILLFLPPSVLLLWTIAFTGEYWGWLALSLLVGNIWIFYLLVRDEFFRPNLFSVISIFSLPVAATTMTVYSDVASIYVYIFSGLAWSLIMLTCTILNKSNWFDYDWELEWKNVLIASLCTIPINALTMISDKSIPDVLAWVIALIVASLQLVALRYVQKYW